MIRKISYGIWCFTFGLWFIGMSIGGYHVLNGIDIPNYALYMSLSPMIGAFAILFGLINDYD